MSKVANSTNKTASKVSFQEIRMMYGSQGYSVSACMRQSRNAYDEWDVDRSKVYLLEIAHNEFMKYVNSTRGEVEPSDEIWR